MTHHIELTVTCDQSELDKLLAVLGQWSFEAQQRGFSGEERMRVHTFLVDGKPAWDEAQHDAKVVRERKEAKE